MKSVTLRVALLGLLLACVAAAPTNQGKDWDIYSFHINSTVTSRYATTVITSRVANRLERSKEVEFHVQIPKNAFISKFRMVIKGETYDGVVKQKEEAEKQYTRAVSRGQSAGLVSSVGRTLEDFRTAVTVAAFSKVTFELTYEELLKRRLGKYELLIHTKPMQPVVDFKVDVYISEKPGITFLETKGGLSKTLANAITSTHANDQAWVHFYPTVDQQKSCGGGCGETGLDGDLVVVYDVNRDDSPGDVVGSDGYFVHHFAPKDLPRIPKNVVFLIDRSGSMHGRKMEQTRDAMVKILGDLAEDDYFGLITFDSSLSTWKRELVQASNNNLNAAKNFARNIRDSGATDINAAVLKGAQLLKDHPREGSASLLILLTDGDPTSGVTNLETIQANVREAISKKFPLYCLGFGFDVNFEFLSSMALENNGAARRIYQDSDAALQLQGFYEEVATPLLTDVQMIYIGGANLTQTNFSQYYNGSEIVVAGQITDNDMESFTTQVIGISKSRKVEFVDKTSTVQSMNPHGNSSISRVWAYLTVKQLLDREVQYSGVEKEKAKETALQLALQYGFVTPHTSMVVTKPEGDDTQVAHKPKEEGKEPERHYASMPSLTARSDTFDDDYDADYFSLPSADVSLSVPQHTAHFRQSGSQQHHPGLPGPPMHGSRQHHPGHAGPPMHGYQYQYQYGAPYQPPWRPPQVYNPVKMIDQEDALVKLVAPSLPPAPTMSHAPTRPPAPTTLGYAYDSYYDLYGVTQEPSTQKPVCSLRVVLPAVGSLLPLCYDIPASQRVRILQSTAVPDHECTINGQILNKGFKEIDIYYQTVKLTLEVSPTPTLIIRDGQNSTSFLWTSGATFTDYIKDRMTVIMREKEMDITVGDARIVILFKDRKGVTFMWPALRQRPSGSITGLLAGKPVFYEEIQGASSPTLKINHTEIIVSRSSAVDVSVPSMPSVTCWLVSVQSAQQSGVLSDLTASHP